MINDKLFFNNNTAQYDNINYNQKKISVVTIIILIII